jgi:SAM-dependent methyltransferase
MEVLDTTQSKGKADFDGIYNRPDARAYYQVLGAHGYEIPQHAAEVFGRIVRERSLREGTSASTVLDVCCSYGVGAALLKSDLELDDLYSHYAASELNNVSSEELIRADAALLKEHLLIDAPRVIGIDIADQAIAYAVRAGLLDDGVAENLEESDPSPLFAELLSEVDVITTTGGVGYVTERTFERILDHTVGDPWVAAFCLTVYDFEPIAEMLFKRGFITERGRRTYPQRRFIDEVEKQWALDELVSLGRYDAAETEEHYYADFFLARPAEQVAECSLAELIPEIG